MLLIWNTLLGVSFRDAVHAFYVSSKHGRPFLIVQFHNLEPIPQLERLMISVQSLCSGTQVLHGVLDHHLKNARITFFSSGLADVAQWLGPNVSRSISKVNSAHNSVAMCYSTNPQQEKP